jgi:hypothetical protein
MPLLFGPSEDSAATGADDDAAAATKVADDVGITVVVQRANTADLLVDNVDKWVSIGWGLICSVSFAPAADVSKVSMPPTTRDSGLPRSHHTSVLGWQPVNTREGTRGEPGR